MHWREHCEGSHVKILQTKMPLMHLQAITVAVHTTRTMAEDTTATTTTLVSPHPIASLLVIREVLEFAHGLLEHLLASWRICCLGCSHCCS